MKIHSMEIHFTIQWHNDTQWSLMKILTFMDFNIWFHVFRQGLFFSFCEWLQSLSIPSIAIGSCNTTKHCISFVHTNWSLLSNELECSLLVSFTCSRGHACGMVCSVLVIYLQGNSSLKHLTTWCGFSPTFLPFEPSIMITGSHVFSFRPALFVFWM